MVNMMRTVQMSLDDQLLEEIDLIVKDRKTTRSAFARQAFRSAIAAIRTHEQEKQHEKGYRRLPVRSDEFDCWESEQAWCD